MTDFNLSERMFCDDWKEKAIWEKDVKEFIRLLKESGEVMNTNKNLILLNISDIDKLAGEKLI